MTVDQDLKEGAYFITRVIEIICIGLFFFGLLWEGTIIFNLSTPQFLIAYGGAGAVVTHVLAYFLKKKA